MKIFLLLSLVVIAPALMARDYKKDKDPLLLVVDKSSLTGKLMTWSLSPNESKELMSFKVAIGRADGDKQRQGDLKTPEGIYFSQKIIDGKNLPKKYGANAIPIDFPNPMDVADRKTGYGIWLHGVENHGRISEAKVTEGCVAFFNEDIKVLSELMLPKQGIVMITSRPNLLNRPKDLADVKKATLDWLRAWQLRRIDHYGDFYAKEFRYKRKSRQSYLKFKERVFSSYDKMYVAAHDLLVFTHDKYAIAIMNQDFRGDNRFISEGRKVLYWQKREGGYKIVREVFEKARFKESSYSSEKLAKYMLSSPSRSLSPKLEGAL